MAYLSSENIDAVWADYMDEMATPANPGTFTKAQLKTLVTEIDAWMDDNKASFMSSLSDPAKSGLNNKEILKIFLLVAEKRWEVT